MNAARIALLSLVIVSLSCKSEDQGAVALADTKVDGRADGKVASTIDGQCAASEMSGDGMERMSGLTGVRISLPRPGAEGHAVIKFAGASALESLTIVEGLDLYDRQGRLAQLSGGIFKENFESVMTARVFVDSTNGGRTGFAEITLHGATKVQMQAKLACTWSE